MLIIIGVIVCAASFLLPKKYSENDTGNIKEQERKIKIFLQRELQNIRIGIEEKVDESMVASTEKTERYMERITNEKIMAIQEYSDTVLEQIHKNHEEAVFLYDMLNNKHDQIKHTAGEISASVDNAKEKLELAVQDTVRELLRGSIRENLLEKIQRMLEETVQEAIDTSIKETLQEKIDYTVQCGIQEAVNADLMDVIKEAVDRVAKESLSKFLVVPEPVKAEPVKVETESVAGDKDMVGPISDIAEEPVPVPDIVDKEIEEIDEIEEEPSAGEFKGFSFDFPEVIIEEEQPIVVQALKKSVPKKKIPSKKNHPRTLSTLGGQSENEAQDYLETARDGGNSNKDKILKLHKEGMSDVAIARELGLGIGEVKLVIELFE